MEVSRGSISIDISKVSVQEELSLFVPWLLREIEAVRPRALVTLGNVPLKALTGEKSTVGACHGQWLDSRAGVPLFSLYHPASVIYRRALAPVYEQDVLALAASLEERGLRGPG